MRNGPVAMMLALGLSEACAHVDKPIQADEIFLPQSEVAVIQEGSALEVLDVCLITPAVENLWEFLRDTSLDPAPIEELLAGLDDRQWQRVSQTYTARVVRGLSDPAVMEVLDPKFKEAVRREMQRRKAKKTP